MAISSVLHIPSVFPHRRPARGWIAGAVRVLSRLERLRSDYAALLHLSEASDVQLAARGLDRTAEMRRILGLRSLY